MRLLCAPPVDRGTLQVTVVTSGALALDAPLSLDEQSNQSDRTSEPPSVAPVAVACCCVTSKTASGVMRIRRQGGAHSGANRAPISRISAMVSAVRLALP